MIGHFVKRDLATFKVFWAVLLVVSGIAIPLILATKRAELVGLLAYAYFLFAMLPIQQLTGVSWRSQHIMSRNYLLSLPIPRKSQYNIIQIRALVFWSPLFILAAVLPLLLDFKALPLGPSYLIHCLAVASISIWLTNKMIETQLQWERITTYLTLQRRTLAWIVALGTTILEVGIAFGLLAASPRIGVVWLIFYLVAVAYFRFHRTRRKWLGV